MSKLLGRPLTELEVVHHVDEDTKNNAPDNLMLFATQAEHLKHHASQRALKASGDSSYHKCTFCKEYDSPLNMYISKSGHQAWHRACYNSYQQERRN